MKENKKNPYFLEVFAKHSLQHCSSSFIHRWTFSAISTSKSRRWFNLCDTLFHSSTFCRKIWKPLLNRAIGSVMSSDRIRPIINIICLQITFSIILQFLKEYYGEKTYVIENSMFWPLFHLIRYPLFNSIQETCCIVHLRNVRIFIEVIWFGSFRIR